VTKARRVCILLVALGLLGAAACSDDDGGADATDDATTDATTGDGGGAPATAIVFNGEGNNLNAFSGEAPFEKQRVITNAEEDPDGLDINAQICFFPDDSGWFIAGEDTGQPEQPAGWGIFELEGDRIGELSATQVGKLTPTYQGDADDQPENYGCGFLSDGRVLTTDIGGQQSGPGTGQLIVWFPPFDSRDVSYCKLDVTIPTAGGIYVDDEDRVYVPSARPPDSGVFRYTGPFPTSADAAGGCGQTDGTGAPMADAVTKEQFIELGNGLVSPNAIVGSPASGFYVSSVINGVINEYDANGAYVRTVLQPPAGETIGEQTFSSGTPLGLAVGSDGTIYYADIGITVTADGVGPGPVGTVRRITFVDGEPQPPEIMGGDLAFPDGIGVFEPRR